MFPGLRTFSREGQPDPSDDFDEALNASHAYLHDILARADDACTLLAEDESGQLTGYLIAVIHPPNPLTSSGAVTSGSIDELFVAEGARGSGTAGALLRAVESWFRARGA